jgi:membrane-bound lytic murein transglycosylase B
VQNQIDETEANIKKKEDTIRALESQLDLNREVLSGLVQELYYSKNLPFVEVLLSEDDVKAAFSTSDSLFSTQEKIQAMLDEMKRNKEKIASEKSSLEESQKDHEELLAVKNAQKQSLAEDQAEQSEAVEKQEATVGELNQKLSELKSDLSSFLGESISADDIVDAASIASRATGVRKDFILGELVVETDLGRFTGGCYYSKGKNPVGKHMKSADKAAFLDLMDDLDYDKNEKKLSCWPGYGYGGAMGVAQFMPTTWNGYKSRIAAKTGHNPPDPWDITDGVMGMAIKLAAAGATSKSGEKNASKRYYCGGPSSPYWNNTCNDYASKVQYWAKNYEDKL